MDYTNLVKTSSRVIPLGSFKLTITMINVQQNKILIIVFQQLFLSSL
uniref:Uncharacterized protein n=1 Tax=uncultured delta proteobacterium HF0130_19C20 TaxID=710828 RepID=E0XT79_9DELT|nr:hypothetical protein [uncultured delta proteobacterium HF0130_19C20]